MKLAVPSLKEIKQRKVLLFILSKKSVIQKTAHLHCTNGKNECTVHLAESKKIWKWNIWSFWAKEQKTYENETGWLVLLLCLGCWEDHRHLLATGWSHSHGLLVGKAYEETNHTIKLCNRWHLQFNRTLTKKKTNQRGCSPGWIGTICSGYQIVYKIQVCICIPIEYAWANTLTHFHV